MEQMGIVHSPDFLKGPFARLVAAPQRKAKRQKTSIFKPT
jgi:hypothetical protein